MVENQNIKDAEQALTDSTITMEISILDMKYLSVRFLYANWFFNSGAEIANQMLDALIKLYLASIKRYDLYNGIRHWGGNKSHDLIKIIKFINEELDLKFNFGENEEGLTNIYKIYRCRYIEDLKNVQNAGTIGKDVHVIDYTYKFFRDRIPEKLKKETLIDKVLLIGVPFYWSDRNLDLTDLLKLENRSF